MELVIKEEMNRIFHIRASVNEFGKLRTDR